MGALLFFAGATSPAFAERAFHEESAARVAQARRARPAYVVDLEGSARLALSRVSKAAATKTAVLVATSTAHYGDGDAIVRFDQTHRGLPVIGRGATVRLAASGAALATSVDVEEALPDTTPALDASRAAAIAARLVPGDVTADDAHLVVWPLRGGGARLAYAVLPRVPTGIAAAPRIVVDATTGKVLEARDLARSAGMARVYPQNPIATPELQDLPLAIVPPGETLTSDVVVASNCIDNKTVKKVNMFGLNTNLHVCDIVQVAKKTETGDFDHAPADVPNSAESKRDAYAELSIYFHTSKAYAFFRELQGVPDATVVRDKPLRVVANLQLAAGLTSGNFATAADPDRALEPFQNAFFSPAGGGLGQIFEQLYGLKGGGLWFGQGPQRDYAYDGDVVYHEFTHAVVDDTLKLGAWHIDARGAIDAPGAMNEGLSDYFSSAITGDPDVGEYASKDISGASVIRTLANDDRCPSALIGEVHIDSTLFSGGLWQARTSLPEADRAKFDAALYKAMRTSSGRSEVGFDDVTKMFLSTLKTDLPAGATALEAAMTSRGVLPACERIFEAKETGVRAFDGAAGGFAAPGTQSLGLTGELAPGILQVHGAVPAGAGKVTVSFSSRASGGGGGSPFGGGGTPFTPVVLVKAGKAITWTVSRGEATHDADSTTAAEKAGRYTASVEIAEGATDVYLQIANKGESDGVYDDVTVAFGPRDAAPTEPTPPAPAPAAPVADASAAEDGCVVASPGRHVGSTSAAAVLAAAALVTAARRRRARA